MSAKITFNDIYNQELAPTKLSSVTFNSALSSSSGVPSYTANAGSLYLNTDSGSLYRNTNGASAWVEISSLTTVILTNKYPTLTSTVVSSTDSSTPAAGDLIGLHGAGVWATSGLISASKYLCGSAGAQNAGLIAGGQTSVTAQLVSELFNGSAWALTGSLSVSRTALAGSGAQNAALMMGGNAAIAFVSTEAFNGSTWAASGSLNATRDLACGFGTQTASVIAGGYANVSGTPVLMSSETFNGTTWAISGNLSASKYQPGSAGSQNAGLLTGGSFFSSAVQIISELFNGSAWVISGVMSASKAILPAMGTQSSCLIAGGNTGANTNVSELFNGSAWALTGNINLAKAGAAGAGAQNAGLIAGGGGAALQNTTELHSQTVYRKVYSNQIKTAKNIGIFDGTSLLYKQGKTTVLYPVNKYLISNRFMNISVTNVVDVSAIALGSVLGTAPAMTYNFNSSVNVLSVMPGMVARISGSGGTPANSSNTGNFIISRVISPTSIEVVNASGVSQNPATGTISIISTMLFVDSISPQDIVIGKTDSTGALILHKPVTVSSISRRLK